MIQTTQPKDEKWLMPCIQTQGQIGTIISVMRNSMRTLILVLAVFVSCSIQGMAEEEKASKESVQTKMSRMGVVTGKVSFGPLRPGPAREDEQEENQDVLRKIYAEHKVKVLAADGKRTVREVEINSQGIYKVELEPGIYFLQITPPAMGKWQKQSLRTELKPGETVQVDISVDTGLR